MVIATRLSHGTCAISARSRVTAAAGEAFVASVGRRSPLRRLALAIAVLAAIVLAGGTVGWGSSPDPSGIQARGKALTEARGIALLGENEVPPRLADVGRAPE